MQIPRPDRRPLALIFQVLVLELGPESWFQHQKASIPKDS